MKDELNLSKKEYDRMIDHTINQGGGKAMVEGVERRNQMRKDIRDRAKKNRREAVVSNFYISGFRGVASDPSMTPVARPNSFFERFKQKLRRLFAKKKPIAGKYKFTMRNGKSVMVSWPSHLKPDELAYAARFYNCQLASGS